MSVALRGNLKDFGIAEVFQLIGQQRKTGVLEIVRQAEVVRLLFDEGAVVSAEPQGSSENAAFGDMLVRCGLLTRERLRQFERESEDSLQRLGTLLQQEGVLSADQVEEIEDLLTRNTLFGLLRWSEGLFDFTPQPVDHDRDASRLLGAEQILMDGLRMVDEWRTFAQQVPSEDTVFQRTGRFESYQAEAQGEARRRLTEARRVFLLVDGRLVTRRVIDLARLGTFEGTRVLADLRAAGLIEPMDPKRVAQRRRRAVDFAPRSVRGWLGGTLQLVLLAALAAYSQRPPPAPVQQGAFPIERAAFDQARGAFEAKRLRNALDAHRFARGRWPERLEDLVAAGLLEPDALASSGERSYYYVRRGESVLLLAPEY